MCIRDRSGGVLLIVGTLQELGIIVEPYSVSKAAIPMAFISVILSFVQNYWTDMTLSKAHVDTQLEKEVKE